MDFIKLRKSLKMSQAEFAIEFGIPLSTIRNWEQGTRKPPEYIYYLIERILEKENMVNVETLKFQKMLDELAEKTTYGYKEWSKIPTPSFEDFQNPKYKNFQGVMYDKNNENRIILDACLFPEHHDIRAYYDDIYTDCIFQVMNKDICKDYEDDEIFIQIKIKKNLYDEEESYEYIVIENGRWYFA